jgi:hypothetical protein
MAAIDPIVGAFPGVTTAGSNAVTQLPPGARQAGRGAAGPAPTRTGGAWNALVRRLSAASSDTRAERRAGLSGVGHHALLLVKSVRSVAYLRRDFSPGQQIFSAIGSSDGERDVRTSVAH